MCSASMVSNVGYSYKHRRIPLQVSNFLAELYSVGAGHPGEDDIGGLVLVGHRSA